MCDLDPKVKVIGKKAGICDGVPSTAALVYINIGPGIYDKDILLDFENMYLVHCCYGSYGERSGLVVECLT